jgi:hypothetical protein
MAKEIDVNSAPHGTIQPEPLVGESIFQTFITQLEDILDKFNRAANISSNLTGVERSRLFGAKSRHFGFISKSLDIARDNPAFMPPNFSLPVFEARVRMFEEIRQLTIVLEQFQHAATDYLLESSDAAYRDALRVYGSLREQARANVAGASALFAELLQYFTLHHRGRPGSEPTEKELERDFHALVHGHKDGEIIVRNETPHAQGGERTIVDDVHRSHGAIKESGEAEIRE